MGVGPAVPDGVDVRHGRTYTMTPIYLDNNATTPMLPAVWEAMRPFFTDIHGNPASAHQFGRRARRALEDAREKIAALLDAYPDEVLFTSGATEANNLALFGLVGDPPGHLIVSAVEHPSVLEPARELVRRGFEVTWLPVDKDGSARVELLPQLYRPDTRLVCLMFINHETGETQPVEALREWLEGLEGAAPLFHCDAVQAVGKTREVCFHRLGATTLSLSGHKFHGPKGIGALLVRRGVRLRSLMFGGHQQRGWRPGTEPVALAVGLATALELAQREWQVRFDRVLALRARFLEGLKEHAEPFIRNGPTVRCGIPHVLNISFPGLRAEALLMNLDLAGVACSTGSACSSGSLLRSPVLRAMGVPDDMLTSAMRFSLSHLLSVEEIDEAARRVGQVVRRLRALKRED